MPSLISISNCDDTTVDDMMVKYEATNMTSDKGNFLSETAIDSETK